MKQTKEHSWSDDAQNNVCTDLHGWERTRVVRVSFGYLPVIKKVRK